MKALLVATASVIVGFLILGAIFGETPEERHKRGLEAMRETSEKNLLMSSLRLQITSAQLDGKGKLTKQQCEQLRDLVKSHQPDADWFSKCSGKFYFNDSETESKEVITMSDGDYCAVIDFEKESDKIIDYEFKDHDASCKGYSIIVSEDRE